MSDESETIVLDFVLIPYSKFARALRLCVPVVAKNVKNPNILLTVTRSEITLEATNGQVLLCYKMEAKANFTGQLLLPPRILQAVKAETGGDVIILPGKQSTVQVRIGQDSWEFPTEDPAEYPVVNWSSGIDGSVPSDQLLDAIKFVEHAMDKAGESTRYALSGICLEICWGSKVFVQATNGSRLAFTEVELNNEADEPKTGKQTVVIPQENIATLKALCQLDDRVELVEVGEQLQFTAGSLVMISKLLQGKFPAVRSTQIKDMPFATMKAGELYQALAVAAVCVDAETPGVELAFTVAVHESDEQASVTATCISTLGRSSGNGWCTVVHKPEQITIAPHFVMEPLKNLDPDTELSLRTNDKGTLQINCKGGVLLIAGMDSK